MGDRPRNDMAAMRAVRELFKGRFTDAEVAKLYDLNNRSRDGTVNYILTAEPHDVRETLEQQDGWHIVSSRRPIPQDLVERVRHGFVTTTTRQYACAPCDVSWWRCVPQRKQVSRCKRCRSRYDPVPRNREWGWAEFHCTFCNNDFSGYCQMDQASPCYGCGRRVLPTRIKAPAKKHKRDGRAARSQGHNCDACRGGLMGTTCVHPQTRKLLRLPLVVTPSVAHDSTGSTVDTFLPQNIPDMEEFNAMASIHEEDESSDDD